jgi:prepilin-type N-terminal cleavage/methylation domain-containing protein
MSSTASRLRHEAGFTLIEVMVATALLTVAILGVVSSIDNLRANASGSERRQSATHRAEQEMEALRAVGYRALVLKDTPGTSTDPRDPRSNVVAGAPPTYRPSADVSAQPMIIDAGDPDAMDPAVPWQSGGVSGTVYRFITQGTGAACGQVCPRRVTVVVTTERDGVVDGKAAITTLVTDPQDTGADDAATPAPTPPACPCWNTLYAYDTPAKFISRQDPTDHIVRQWNDHPDLLGYDAPPLNGDGTTPPLRKYTTDLGALVVPNDDTGYPGGRVIKQSPGCDSEGDPKKTMRWTTPPVQTATTLQGDASFTIYTQTAGGGPGLGWLCLTAWDWTIDANGKAGGAKKLKSFGCSENPWPQTVDVMTCGGRFLDAATPSYTLPVGHALGIELTVWDQSVLDAVILYDHPDYPSSFSWSSTPSMMP